MRIQYGCSWWDSYERKLKHDDVVTIPELFGKEKNMTYYSDIVKELEELDPERTSDCQDRGGFVNIQLVGVSPTIKIICNRLCEYFRLDRESVKLGVNLRKAEYLGDTFKFIKP